MSTIEPGRKVSVFYIGTLDNGRIFDSTPDDQPLVFTVGEQEIFPALEREIVTMAVGEVRNLTITAEEAYGPRRQENIIRLPRSAFPQDREIKVGQKLSLEFQGSRQRIMLVFAVDDHEVTLDGNHPLAGLDLVFALKLHAVE